MTESTSLTRLVLVAPPRAEHGPAVRRLRLARVRVQELGAQPSGDGERLARLRRGYD